MNTSAHFEVARETDQVKNPFRLLTPDTALEGASFHEPGQPPNTVRPYVLEDDSLETFIGGEGI
jgi:hypothetical protein